MILSVLLYSVFLLLRRFLAASFSLLDTLKRTLARTTRSHRRQQSIVSTIHDFLSHVSYTTPRTNPSRRQELVSALESTLLSWGIGTKKASIQRVCKHSAAMAELSYHGHDFETQLQIAKFTWFMIYIDDLASSMPSALEDFQSKLFRRETLDDPVLQAFTGHLADMYKFYDTLPANCITTATLEFVTGCALEIHPEIRNIRLSSSSTSWPYFLRAKTGVAPAYAFMIFRTITSDMSRYMQAIADICLFIDLTNDVLSFYKEELAGETANYIHNRAVVSGKTPAMILAEVATESKAAYDRVSDLLNTSGGSNDGSRAWEIFVNGYVAFHMTQDRYRLNELLL